MLLVASACVLVWFLLAPVVVCVRGPSCRCRLAPSCPGCWADVARCGVVCGGVCGSVAWHEFCGVGVGCAWFIVCAWFVRAMSACVLCFRLCVGVMCWRGLWLVAYSVVLSV